MFKKTKKWLYLVIIICFILTSLFSCGIEKKVMEAKQALLIKTSESEDLNQGVHFTGKSIIFDKNFMEKIDYKPDLPVYVYFYDIDHKNGWLEDSLLNYRKEDLHELKYDDSSETFTFNFPENSGMESSMFNLYQISTKDHKIIWLNLMKVSSSKYVYYNRSR